MEERSRSGNMSGQTLSSKTAPDTTSGRNEKPPRAVSHTSPSHSPAVTQRKLNETSKPLSRDDDLYHPSTFGPDPATERRIKRHWYPILLLAIALNFCLLFSCFYLTYNSQYYGENRPAFLGLAFTIIFVPLVPIAILLLSPWPISWKQRRDAFSERDSSPRWKHIINIAAALTSFVIVLCYLLFSAVPRFNSPVWQTSVSFMNEVPVPAVALIVLDTDLSGSQLPISFNQTGADYLADAVIYDGYRGYPVIDPVDMYEESFNFSAGRFNAVVVNVSNIRPYLDSPLGSSIMMSLNLTFNATIASQRAYVAQVLLAVFDPRMSVSTILECGLVQGLAISAFRDNTFLLSMSQITDHHRMIAPSAFYPSYCMDIYSGLLSHDDPPFTFFDAALTMSSESVQDYEQTCDIATDPEVRCRTSVTLAYGSQFVTRQRSIPGRSRQEIWIDCGAIVGAIQFFQWFFLVFFHG